MYIVSNRTKPRKGLWTKPKREFGDLIRSASFTEVGVALDYSANWQTREGSPEFDIPYDRQGLADFLCVDRSALSSVIGRLAKKGLLSYHKNHFVLKGYSALA